MDNFTVKDLGHAIQFATIVAGADRLRSAGLLEEAAVHFFRVASLAPDREIETALLTRAFECTERAHWWQRG